MAERFLFFFALLGIAAWAAVYLIDRRRDARLRCLTWGMRLHTGCAGVLYLLVCFQPGSAVSRLMRPPVEAAIVYTHHVLFDCASFL
jgi:hypothetical protein